MMPSESSTAEDLFIFFLKKDNICIASFHAFFQIITKKCLFPKTVTSQIYSSTLWFVCLNYKLMS